MVTYTRISPYKTPRAYPLTRLTIHCAVALWTTKQGVDYFATNKAKGKPSCNYFIGRDGGVGLSVPENYKANTSSSSDNDHRAITIECASSMADPYAFPDATYKTLVRLVVDVCRRNGKNKLVWISDKSTALKYSPKPGELLLTLHKWFKNKDCPGRWFLTRIPEFVDEVNTILKGEPVKQTFLVRVNRTDLNIRQGAGTNYPIVGIIPKGVFTITEVVPGRGAVNGWGKLKSGVGFISLDYVIRV